MAAAGSRRTHICRVTTVLVRRHDARRLHTACNSHASRGIRKLSGGSGVAAGGPNRGMRAIRAKQAPIHSGPVRPLGDRKQGGETAAASFTVTNTGNRRRARTRRSRRRQLALGPQPVRDLVSSTLFERNEVGTLGDLVVTGRAPVRPRRARARWPTGPPSPRDRRGGRRRFSRVAGYVGLAAVAAVARFSRVAGLAGLSWRSVSTSRW
jgi:hypothetical protein